MQSYKDFLILLEAKRNLQFDLYKENMVNILGCEYRYQDPTHFFSKTFTRKNKRTGETEELKLTTSTHERHNGIIDAAAWTNMKNIILRGYQFNGDDSYIKKINWLQIGLNSVAKNYKNDAANLQNEINKANAKYANAEIIYLTPGGEKDSRIHFCVMKVGDVYTTITSPDDRRPIIQNTNLDIEDDDDRIEIPTDIVWFDEIALAKEARDPENIKIVAKKLTDRTRKDGSMITDVFPLNAYGMLTDDPVLQESLEYNFSENKKN